MRDRDSTVRSRELGDGLRAAMTGAGYNASELARILDWSPGRVSRLLSGRRGGSRTDVVAVLAVCRVTGQEREHLLSLCDNVGRRGWFQQHGARLPARLRTLIDHEQRAAEISDFEPVFVPGLLQTEDYARAVFHRLVTIPDREIAERVAARMERQAIIDVPRMRFTFLIHEFALRLPVGSAALMSEQLHTLLRLSVLHNVTIRVIPAAYGAYPGMSGGCRLMDFIEGAPVVYLEGEVSCAFLEEPEEVAGYRSVFGALAECALPEGQSRELIAHLAVTLYANRGDVHVLAQEQLQRYQQLC